MLSSWSSFRPGSMPKNCGRAWLWEIHQSWNLNHSSRGDFARPLLHIVTWCYLLSSFTAHSSAWAACRFAKAVLGTNAAGALGSLSGPCDCQLCTFAVPDLGRPRNKSSPFVSCYGAALVTVMQFLHDFACLQVAVDSRCVLWWKLAGKTLWS